MCKISVKTINSTFMKNRLCQKYTGFFNAEPQAKNNQIMGISDLKLKKLFQGILIPQELG